MFALTASQRFFLFSEPVDMRKSFDALNGIIFSEMGKDALSGDVYILLLKNYRGYLQTDGYGVYEGFESREDIVLVGCLVHARRNFEHALENDRSRAEKVLLCMQELYAIEREAKEKNLNAQQRYLLRREKACAVMDHLGEWLVKEYAQVLPKSAIGKAIYYLVARYNKIYMYLEDGRLEADNNLINNAIRPVALGRKNYLFAVRQERCNPNSDALVKMREVASRSRLTGAGFKLPYAA